MESALDTFRAQREVAAEVHAELTAVAELLTELRDQVDAITGNAELRAVLRDEQDWLRQAQQLIADVRHFREQERLSFWPCVWRRWALAVLLALASAAAAGTGYARWTEPHSSELAALRRRAELADAIVVRVEAMTPAERRQFERLMFPTVTR